MNSEIAYEKKNAQLKGTRGKEGSTKARHVIFFFFAPFLGGMTLLGQLKKLVQKLFYNER
jgi:hypothetical protein